LQHLALCAANVFQLVQKSFYLLCHFGNLSCSCFCGIYLLLNLCFEEFNVGFI
jgi:hypothetical protein